MKTLAVIVTRSHSHCQATVKSLNSQTAKPRIHVEIGYPIPKMQVGNLVCHYANKALAKHDLTRYDYILKSDEDVLYPPNFLEANTALGYDLLGSGACLLIKTATFLEVMGGRFIPNSFHAGLIHDIFNRTRRKTSWEYSVAKPVIARRESMTPKRSFWSGYDQYRYRPKKLGMIKYYLTDLIKCPFLVFCLLGYVCAGLSRQQQYML